MRSNLVLLLSVLALFAITQATPSFRRLQQGTTVAPNNTNTTTPPVNPHPGYSALTLLEIQASENATSAYRHAMNAMVQTAIAQGKIPVSVYTVSTLYGAWSRRVRAGVSYIFNALLVAENGVNFACNVTVLRNYTSGRNGMTAYHYRAWNIRRNMFPANGYRFLTPAQVHNNTIVQGALIYGAKEMIEWLINEKKIPSTSLNYTVYELNLAAYRRTNRGTNYRFQIFAANEAGLNLRTNYTVFYRNSNKSYDQTQYWYRAWNFSRDDIVPNNTGNNTGNSTVNVTVPVDTNTTNVNVTVVVVNATEPEAGSNSSAGIPEVSVPPSEEVNVDISLVSADNSTATTTALINLNYTFPPPAVDPIPVPDNTTLPVPDPTLPVPDPNVPVPPAETP